LFIISKFIAKEWFKAIISSITVLFLLITVGDILNGFLQNYELRRIVLEYFLKMPEIMGKMLPITTLLASLFAINKLKNHSELMGILAAGFSAKKIYSLIFTCSLFIAFIQFLNLGFISPFANKIKRQEFEKSRKNESRYLARSRVGDSGLIWYKTEKYFTSFQAFDSKEATLKNVSVYFLSTKKKLESVYQADSAKFIKNKTWELTNVTVTEGLNNEAFPKSIKPKKMLVELGEAPADFKQFESDITTLNLFELKSFIARLQATDITSTEYEVMFFEKLSLVYICIIFALFPLASIFNPNRRAASFGKSIVLTLVFSTVFWLIYSGAISLGNKGTLSPLVAVFIVPILFSFYIAFTLHKNRKL